MMKTNEELEKKILGLDVRSRALETVLVLLLNSLSDQEKRKLLRAVSETIDIASMYSGVGIPYVAEGTRLSDELAKYQREVTASVLELLRQGIPEIESE